MIDLTAEEARTLVSSYVWLMELGEEHGFPMRPEEYRLYDRVNGALEIETMRDEIGMGLRKPNPPFIPDPPPNPHAEEDSYEPNVA